MLRIIGDVHGKFSEYLKICRESPYPTLQVGDMGFDYSSLNELDPSVHKFIAGNHDNYQNLPLHGLSDFGKLDTPPLFYVRGGHSIDRALRTPGLDWFPYEELNLYEMHRALSAYRKARPSVMVTHEPPGFISKKLGNPEVLNHYGYAVDWTSQTAQLLQEMFVIHKPQYWFFGHMHVSFNEVIRRCNFVGLNELEVVDFES